MRLAVALTTAFSAFALVAAAPPALASREPLTLGAAVSLALQKNPDVQQARAKIGETDHSIGLAWSQLFPSISAGGTVNYRKDAVNNPFALFGGEPYDLYNIGLQFTQPLFAGGLLAGGIKYARTGKAIAEVDRDIAERDLTVNVLDAFYDLLLSQRKVETLERNRQVEDELLQATQRRVRIGRSQPLDIMQVKTQLALLDPQIAQARNQVQISATRLASLLGERDTGEIAVQGSLDSVPWQRVQEEAKKAKYRILENERLEQQLLQLDANRSVTLAKHWPQLSALGTWGRSAYVRTDILSDDATTWAVGLQLSIPLFSGLSSFQERKVLASQEQELEISRVQLMDTTSLAQVQTLKDVDLSVNVIESSRIAYNLGQDSLREAQKDYRLAMIDMLQYLTSEQTLLQAELAYDQARHDYIVNLAKYYVSWGYPLGDLVSLLDPGKE